MRCDARPLNFNTKKVRLKLEFADILPVVWKHFNTKKVRLKLARAAAEVPPSDRISIPKRCD